MARKRSSILSLDGSAPRPPGNKRVYGGRIWFWLGLLGAVLVLAWFDGGEEPIRPITHEIPLPGAG